MEGAYLRTVVLLSLIALGFILKKAGFLKVEECKGLSKVFLSLTLPAVIVSGFGAFSGDKSLIILVLPGFIYGCIMAAVTLFFQRHQTREDKAFGAINCAAFNIGSFSLPFLQGYLSSADLLIVLLYDVGNGIMSFGGTDALGKLIMDWKSPGIIKNALKRMAYSPAVWTYTLMLCISLIGFRLPNKIYDAAGIIGAANPVISMLIIGCMLDFTDLKTTLPKIGKLLAQHYVTVAVLALGSYYLLPFSLMVRCILVILLFSPLGSVGVIVTERYKLDYKAAGLMNSISVLISIIAIMILIPILLG